MKKVVVLIIIVLVIGFFWPKSYISSPGFVTPEGVEQFNQTAKKCLGYSYLTNAMAVAADAPGKSLCFGWLIN